MVTLERNERVRELLKTLESHGPGERLHAERVAVYSVATAEKLGLDEDRLGTIRYAALLHDVGKVQVSPEILGKIGSLTDEEMDQLRMHSWLALSVLKSYDWLRPCIPIIHRHHERWNGTGYPDGLAGVEIPLGARIVGLAEAYDAMANPVRYRSSLDEVVALERVQEARDQDFDPEVVDAFVEVQKVIQPLIAS
jgi:HD-GYP domain-containing protein (c-di-GMP phosphodiesterase class II)